MPKETIKAQIERETADIIEGQIRALSTVDSLGNTRYLRPDRTNDKVYTSTLELLKPLSKYERSIVRAAVNNARMERNSETATIRRADRESANAARGGFPFVPRETFTATARVYEKDQFGNMRSTVIVVSGLETLDAASVIERIKSERAGQEAPIMDGKYLRYSFKGASRRPGPDSNWDISHAQIYRDAIDR